MSTTIWFVLGLVIGMMIGRRQGRKEVMGGAGKAVGERKDAAKARIMELFATKPEIANNDVEHLLGVSDATATNYLSELEAEGKITQIGGEGSGVRYRRNG
jgi:Fic family protein